MSDKLLSNMDYWLLEWIIV